MTSEHKFSLGSPSFFRIHTLSVAFVIFFFGTCINSPLVSANPRNLTSKPSCLHDNWADCLSRTNNDLKSLSASRNTLEAKCKAGDSLSCSQLCSWDAIERHFVTAEKYCNRACRGGSKLACSAIDLYLKGSSHEGQEPRIDVASLMQTVLDLGCTETKSGLCHPGQMRDGLSSLLRANSYLLSWSITLGCKLGHEKACGLRSHILRNTSTNNSQEEDNDADIVTSLLTYGCQNLSSQVCGVAALLEGSSLLRNFSLER